MGCMSVVGKSDVGRIGNAFVRIYGAYVALVIGLLLFVAPYMDYHYCNVPFKTSFPIYLVGAFCLGALVSLVAAKAGARKPSALVHHPKRFSCIVVSLTAVLLILQLTIFYGCMFYTCWDVSVLTAIDSFDANAGYYSRYPNQLFLGGLFIRLGELGYALGVGNHYLFLAVIGSVGVALSVLMTAFIAQAIGGDGVGYASFAAVGLLGGLSPWILVPYSDAYGMFWVTLSMFAFVCLKNRNVAWFLTVFSTIIGYAIKPTAIFILVAIVLVKALQLVRALRTDPLARTRSKELFAKRSASILAAFLLGACCMAAVKPHPSGLNEEEALPFSHYLMMGANAEAGGGYAQEDVDYSFSFATYEERDEADRARWVERMADLGFSGALELWMEKSLSNYGDGSFSWGVEGGFFALDKTGRIELLKDFYGIGDEREKIFKEPFQAVWFAVLFGIVLFCFLRRTYGEDEAIITIALLLLSGFLLLFECRARYLFLYLPCFIILGALGWRAFSEMGLTLICNRHR